MTTTTVIGPVTVGAVATRASSITKHTFGSSAGAFNVQAALTGGAQSPGSKLILWYAPLMDSITANLAAVDGAGPAAFRLECYFVPSTSERYFTSDMIGCRGRYLLLWVEEPLMQLTASLTVKVTEY